MSKGGKPMVDVFDLDRIRQIVELMEEHRLSEVDLQQGDDKIRLTRGAPTSSLVSAAAVNAPDTSAAAAPVHSPSPRDESESAGTITINSPMVGTFYGRPNPEAEPFVKVGAVVNAETVVCIIEAMKVFNEIPAECRGKIVEVLVEDQQPVDFGKPLFRIQPSA